MKKYTAHRTVACLLWASIHVLSAQNPDSLRLIPEVLVTGIHETAPKQTSLNIMALQKSSIAEFGTHNLCEALTRLPGVNALTTGVAITKPVVRGLYGNRVLVLLSSLKFDNQQWQDEHGMGLSDVGLERVELIRGPASVLYGSEAVGGVINVIPERPARNGKHADVFLRGSSNTRGINLDAGLGNATDKGWWNVRAGIENHADYSDGSGARVLNSRFNGYYWKATVARRNERFQSVNQYSGSFNNFGFILEDLADFFDPDRRWSRQMIGPHHSVVLNVFSSENTFYRGKNTWKANVGLQSNLRLEDEGGGAISLNMHLISLPYNIRWTHPINAHTELIVSNIGAFENNTNYGSRIIVPDANMLEEGLSIFCKHRAGTVLFEAGVGGSDKFIQTFETRGVNTPDKENRPFVRNRLSANGLAGMTWNPNERWNFKFNLSSGFRAPNLAELASDGLHEGIFHYEIGKPGLRNEQNLNVEADLAYSGAWLSWSIAAFNNRFFDYVYLAPTGRDTFGFPLYRYRQADARLYGGEASLRLSPGVLPGWSLTEEFSTVTGTLKSSGYLPYMPASKWVSRLRFEKDSGKKLRKVYATLGAQYVFEQNNPSENETPTPAYFLLDAGAGGQVSWGKRTVEIRIAGNNLLNRKYVDHLSRFKNYGLYNIGRNVLVSARFHIF